MDPFLPVFQSIICLNLPSFPCMPHSLPILSRSLIPYYLTSTINYHTPHYASFSSLFPFSGQTLFSSFCSQTNSLYINVKKHSPILQTLFYVIHSTHFLTIHILINKINQFKSNKTNHKPNFIFHMNYYVSAPRCHLHSIH